MFHFIFDYNYGNLLQILIFFLPQETGMNTLPNVYKLFYFNLTMSPLYVVKLNMTQKQPTAYAVHSVDLIVPVFWRKSFNVRFFPYLLEHFFGSLPTKIFYILVGFIKNLSSNSIWLILTCKLKLSGRDMRRVTVMTSSS